MPKFTAFSALVGTIIGAGIFGLPFVIQKSGFAIGLAHLLIIGAIMALLMLYLGEIIQRTKTIHQLPGYAEKYLGKKAKKIMFFSVLFGIFSALVAYLVAEGVSISTLVFNSSEYSLLFGLLFWFALSILNYFGIESMKRGESISVIIVFVLMISILVYFVNRIDISNLKFLSGTFSGIFLPFGVVIFAYLGMTALPEINRILQKDKKPMKKVIIYSYLITFIVYLIFTAIVIGIKGIETPEIATIALGKPFILLGILTMFNAYLALSTAMIDTFRFDFQKSKKIAWIYAIAPPMIIYSILELANLASFTKILSISGVVSGGITAVLILLMIRNAKENSESKPSYSMPCSKWIIFPLAAFFIIGAIAEIINILL